VSKILCDKLQPNTKITITTQKGEKKKATIKRMIVMQKYNIEIDEWCPINDVEILLDKKNNTYFSYMCYLRGESWVKEIKIREPK
jgi:hypothetical protein